MFKSNKKITLIIIAALSVIIVAAGTAYVLITANPKSSQQTNNVPTKAQADTLKTQAIEALKNNDTTKAETLFKEAQQQYKTLGDTNNMIDTEAQLYLLEHPSTPSETIDTTAPNTK